MLHGAFMHNDTEGMNHKKEPLQNAISPDAGFFSLVLFRWLTKRSIQASLLGKRCCKKYQWEKLYPRYLLAQKLFTEDNNFELFFCVNNLKQPYCDKMKKQMMLPPDCSVDTWGTDSFKSLSCYMLVECLFLTS